jgi:hypothetical protein
LMDRERKLVTSAYVRKCCPSFWHKENSNDIKRVIHHTSGYKLFMSVSCMVSTIRALRRTSGIFISANRGFLNLSCLTFHPFIFIAMVDRSAFFNFWHW